MNSNVVPQLITALIFDITKFRWRGNLLGIQKILIGAILSFISIMLMLNPWIFAPGIIFDTRSILLSISGLFFSFMPMIIAMVSTAIFRISQGGAAARSVVNIFFATSSIGLLWRYICNKKIDQSVSVFLNLLETDDFIDTV